MGQPALLKGKTMHNSVETIRARLFALQDKKYKEFSSKLIPNVPDERMIGVRTPALRALAKEIYADKKCTDEFLNALPHEYLEENHLHAFILCLLKDYGETVKQLEKFLPFVDNWATCDQMRPKSFMKNTDRLISDIERWIKSDRPYTVRFAAEMLMTHYLDENFKTEYADLVCGIKSDEYYVNMMIAWYFATALAKQYDKTIAYIENKCLDTWVHNKTIQKAVESFRISDEKKAYLKTLKIK